MVTAALRYVISHPAVTVVIPGAKSAEQAATNAQAGSQLLSADELAQYQQAVALA
jgi:aryl-alcohol dehydrogenase-like predicted oxidoreductase